MQHGQQAAPFAHAAAKTGTFITFDVPGSSCLPSFVACTRPTAINPTGAITGIYSDANASLHGFLRDPDGTITKFDGPGAVCSFSFSICTFPEDINFEGAITGFYCDATTCHGFLRRAQSGAFTTIDPPGSTFTEAYGINPAGAITGF